MSEEPHLPRPEETYAYPSPGQRASEELEALIDAQGVRETATFEHLLGAGADVWDSDEEFEEFLKVLAAARKEPG